MKNVKTVKLLSILFALVFLLSACKGEEQETLGDLIGSNEGELSVRVQVDCTPLKARDIQFANGFIYFPGSLLGVFKYDTATNTVSEICSDPLCDHMGTRDSSCNFANRKAFLYINLYY